MFITLCEATEDQIIEAIRRNPEDWIEHGKNDQIAVAMKDDGWKDLFEEAIGNWADHDSVDWYEDEDGDEYIDYKSEKTKAFFKRYLEATLEIVDIDDLEIEVYKANDYLHIKYLKDGEKFDESWYTSLNIFNRIIEVESQK